MQNKLAHLEKDKIGRRHMSRFHRWLQAWKGESLRLFESYMTLETDKAREPLLDCPSMLSLLVRTGVLVKQRQQQTAASGDLCGKVDTTKGKQDDAVRQPARKAYDVTYDKVSREQAVKALRTALSARGDHQLGRSVSIDCNMFDTRETWLRGMIN